MRRAIHRFKTFQPIRTFSQLKNTQSPADKLKEFKSVRDQKIQTMIPAINKIIDKPDSLMPMETLIMLRQSLKLKPDEYRWVISVDDINSFSKQTSEPWLITDEVFNEIKNHFESLNTEDGKYTLEQHPVSPNHGLIVTLSKDAPTKID